MLSKQTLQSHQHLEKDDKSEKLLFANLNILGLIETNELLKRQNENLEFKLNAVINKSAKVIEAYENDLAAKIKLIDLYKANTEESSHECQEHVNELEDAIRILQQLLYKTLDTCEILEADLNESNEKHQTELDAKEKTIIMLKQKLVQNETNNNNQKDTEHDNGVLEKVSVPEVVNRCSQRDLIVTQTATQSYISKKDMQDKKREFNEVEMRLKILFEKMKELFEPPGGNFMSNIENVDQDSYQLADLILKIQEIKRTDVHELKSISDADKQSIIQKKHFSKKTPAK